MPRPIWQTGTALEFEIDAGGNLTIDVGARVSGAERIEEVFGAEIRSWMVWDETARVLTLEKAPILRDDEVILVRFRAWDSDEFSEADFVITLKGSVLASLHNSLLFKSPVNYDGDRISQRGTSTIIREMTDNNYNTFATEADIDIDMSDGAGNPTAIDYIFVKYKGELTEYRAIPTGGTGSAFTRRVPTTIQRFEGGLTDLEVNGFKHDLLTLDSRITADAVRMQFTGTDLEIYALMLLEIGFEIEANASIVEIEFNLVDRGGRIDTSIGGRGRREQTLANARWKWTYAFGVTMDTVAMDTLRNWMEENPNFAFAPEFSRDPEQVFPAFFPSTSVRGEYFTPLKRNGEKVQFRVAER